MVFDYGNTLVLYCEVYQGKPSLFYSDENYHLEKIGSFFARDFSISLNTSYTQDRINSTISLPRNIISSRPIQRGDIISVSALNQVEPTVVSEIKTYRFSSAAGKNGLMYHPQWADLPGVEDNTYNKKPDNVSSEIRRRYLYNRAFVVSSIESDRLVLMDYIQYNMSLVTVGYVGLVQNESFVNVINLISKPDMRVFTTKQYQFTDNNNVIESPFVLDISGKFFNGTSFSDNFTTTNVKPYDILLNALSGLPDEYIQYVPEAYVFRDEDGPYVFMAITATNERADYIETGIKHDYNLSLRIKPVVNAKFTPLINSDLSTVWIQPSSDASDYIRAGVVGVIADRADKRKKTLKTFDKLSEADRHSFDTITELKTVLIGYNDLFNKNYFSKEKEKLGKFLEKEPDRFYFSSNEEYEAAKTQYEERKKEFDDKIKELDDKEKLYLAELKKRLGYPLSRQKVKELLWEAINGTDDTSDMVLDSGITIPKWRSNYLDGLKHNVLNAMQVQYKSAQIEVSSSDFYGVKPLEQLSSWYTYDLFWSSPSGTDLNGETFKIIRTTFTPTQISYIMTGA